MGGLYFLLQFFEGCSPAGLVYCDVPRRRTDEGSGQRGRQEESYGQAGRAEAAWSFPGRSDSSQTLAGRAVEVDSLPSRPDASGSYPGMVAPVADALPVLSAVTDASLPARLGETDAQRTRDEATSVAAARVTEGAESPLRPAPCVGEIAGVS